MLDQLDRLRHVDPGVIDIPRQWPDADFEVISTSIDEQEARFVIAMTDGEIEGDLLDGVRPEDKSTLGNIVRAEKSE